MRIKVKVLPRAKRGEIIELAKDYLKVKLLSAPVKNKANIELIGMLSDYYGVPKSAVKIIKGEHSRKKIVEILFH
jgi:uncharacterized protein (TIGR00251 family)